MSQKKTKTYSASNELKKKIGSGPLNDAMVKRAQKAIEENEVDFTPLGLQFLNELKEALESVEQDKNPHNFEAQKTNLTKPVMELKANATIFHYALIGSLANIMLSFLETIETIDKDAISIVRGHENTLRAILMKKMKGDGGEHGATMVKELKDACNRYYKKRTKKT